MIKKLLLLSLGLFALSSLFSQAFDGYALYNDGNTTYLIDKDGEIAHRWNCDTRGGYAQALTDEGELMRAAVNTGNSLNGAAVAGRVQLLDKDANVIWDFIYSSSEYVSHHDITLMPDGGVLLTAWETKTLAEMQALGYTGSSAKWPTHFIEVQPDGNGGGQIVWEWHMFDHLIQDVDPDKPNYGVVADNPQLMNINVPISGSGGGPGGGGDWFHVNGVDYNEELDLITFTSRFLSEVFVIDHSTTTAEAASHSGGNSGMGGDLMYRWGNPSNYNTTGTRTIDGPCHDARFIPDDGRFRGGFIQFFNNDGSGGSGSAVDAINPPFNGTTFDRTPGEPYGPTEADFRHVCRSRASGQSASDALPNGNTYVNLSRGYMYEVDPNDNLIWQYAEGPSKSFRYICEHPGVKALLGSDACETPVNTDNYLVERDLILAPNPSSGIFQITGLSGENEISIIEVSDASGKLISSLTGELNSIDLSENPDGLYFVKFVFEGNKSQTKLVSVQH